MKKKYNNIRIYLYTVLSFFIFSVFFTFSCSRMLSSLNVAGGVDVEDGEYPGVVHLRTVQSSCTGAVISSNTVLTAAHCTTNGSVEQYLSQNRVKVVRGNTKYKWPPDGDLEAEIESAKYDTAVWVFEDDALKNIKGKIQLSDSKPKVSDEVRLVGWGCYVGFNQKWYQNQKVTELKCNSNYGASKKRTGTNTIGFVPDDLSYIKLYSETSIIDSSSNTEQITGKGVATTFGDSGGPLLLKDQPTKMVGITSYVETPWWPYCNNKNGKNNDEEYKKDCEHIFSGYSNPVSSHNISMLQDMVDNYGAIIPGIQVGIGVVELNGKIKVLYKEESTSFNEKVEEGKVIKTFNNSSYNSVSALKQAWRAINFYERSQAPWSFD